MINSNVKAMPGRLPDGMKVLRRKEPVVLYKEGSANIRFCFITCQKQMRRLQRNKRKRIILRRLKRQPAIFSRILISAIFGVIMLNKVSAESDPMIFPRMIKVVLNQCRQLKEFPAGCCRKKVN